MPDKFNVNNCLYFLYFRLLTILTNKTIIIIIIRLYPSLAFFSFLSLTRRFLFLSFLLWCFTSCVDIYRHVRQLQQQIIKYSNEFFFLFLVDSMKWLVEFSLFHTNRNVRSNKWEDIGGETGKEREREGEREKERFSPSLLRSANESARFYAVTYLTRLLLLK